LTVSWKKLSRIKIWIWLQQINETLYKAVIYQITSALFHCFYGLRTPFPERKHFKNRNKSKNLYLPSITFEGLSMISKLEILVKLFNPSSLQSFQTFSSFYWLLVCIWCLYVYTVRNWIKPKRMLLNQSTQIILKYNKTSD